MINPKYQRYADRLHELVNEGKQVAQLERPSPNSNMVFIRGENEIPLNAWLTKSLNIIQNVFGLKSPQYFAFMQALPKDGIRFVSKSSDVYPLTGVLEGSVNDLENGFLVDQELLIAGAIFDSILEQAKELNDKDYKDPAAVLVRVVLEDALKRLSRNERIDDTQKASILNDELKKINFFPQIQWRFIQTWLDIGNNAAHGKFDTYSKDQVYDMIKGVEQFVLSYLK
jgi:hypothetical protein